jgi:CheY-like chemotaxis protein
MANRPLQKFRILVAEDEALLAMLLEDMLREIGCESVRWVATAEEGIALADTVDVDVALLDVNLNGVPSFALAECLAARGIPIVFSTGYAEVDLPERWRGRPLAAKPYTTADLVAALTSALNDPATQQPA